MTASDVENYKQIKSDLDELRNLVEKSELWVFKDKKGDEPKKKKKSSEGKKVIFLVFCKKKYLKMVHEKKAVIITLYSIGYF